MSLNPKSLFPDFPRKNKSMPDLLSVTPKYSKYMRHHPVEGGKIMKTIWHNNAWKLWKLYDITMHENYENYMTTTHENYENYMI